MKELNFKNQRCPLPLLKMKQALIESSYEEQLQVMTTDEGSLRDIPLYLSRTQHQLISQHQQDGIYHFIIEVGKQHD
ncbi:sulfurtransferase TusA family protein [Marinicellulosiphila megalodicopiae]|uniref:sulfurtransferase TusA family protein n=1 Tax=Marinicellulosiphila megalodicopiae TaxID=2724896 RepID=UPI003BB17D77